MRSGWGLGSVRGCVRGWGPGFADRGSRTGFRGPRFAAAHAAELGSEAADEVEAVEDVEVPGLALHRRACRKTRLP